MKNSYEMSRLCLLEKIDLSELQKTHIFGEKEINFVLNMSM